jgi:CubicO group peptidase (beta-lactamase class C family)
LQAFVAVANGETVFQRFGNGFDADTPHALYSGTKSFWGPLALCAAADGLLDLDEPVGETFATWREGRRAQVTLRALLSLTAGIAFGGLGSSVPPYAKALATEPKDEPGSRFTYGGIPLQIFGAVLARKLEACGLTPQGYLTQRLLEPLGVRVAAWRTLADGTQPLPTGASVAASEWSRFGAYVLTNRSALAPCFAGTAANPRYGLTWWLSPLKSVPDIVYASGAGGQALYVLPSQRLVVVKFGKSGSYDHAAFLRRLVS